MVKRVKVRDEEEGYGRIGKRGDEKEREEEEENEKKKLNVLMVKRGRVTEEGDEKMGKIRI